MKEGNQYPVKIICNQGQVNGQTNCSIAHEREGGINIKSIHSKTKKEKKKKFFDRVINKYN